MSDKNFCANCRTYKPVEQIYKRYQICHECIRSIRKYKMEYYKKYPEKKYPRNML